MAASQPSTRRCPACDSDFMVSARSRTTLENLYFVLGGELCRCQNCEARRAYLGRFILPLSKPTPVPDPNDPGNFRLATIAIFGGIVVCLIIALLTLRRFHRWPF